MIAAGIGLSVVAACLYAVAAVLQSSVVHSVTEENGRLRARQLLRLLRQRRWLLGLLATCTAAGIHVFALSLAPLVIVQPIGVLAIAFTALLAGRAALDRTTVLSVLASVLGVGLFLMFAAPQANGAAVPELAAGRVLPVSAVLVAGCVLAAGMIRRGWARCPLLATGAGIAYGTVSVLTRSVAEQVRTNGIGSLPVLPITLTVLGGLVAILIGGICAQQAYAAGRADTVQACQTVVDPLIGVLFGLIIFHETIGSSPVAVLGELTASVLVVAGVLGLARRRARTTDNPVIPSRRQTMDRPLRIIIGADTYPPNINGAAKFAHQLASGLADRGHDVHVLAPSDTGPAGRSILDGVTVHRVAAHRTPAHPSFRVALPPATHRAARALIEELKPDLVHVQSHFTVCRTLVRAAAKRNIPVVATNHFMPENLFGYLRVPGWLRTSAARLAYRDLARVLTPAQVVTAPTPTAVNLLCRQGFGGRAIAVSCGVDLDRYAGDGSQADGRTVLFVGRLDPEKRVHELLAALALLPERLGVRAEIVGDGACRTELAALADRLGIAERVRFRGFVSDADLVEAYRRSSVFCMPGVAELQSLVTLEAMAAGKPIVAADAVALPHLVVPGRNGWLYPPGEVGVLAGRLAAVFEQTGALARMGAASRELVRRHDMHASLDTFESLYLRAIGADPVRVLVPAQRVALKAAV
ncbi:MAG TPA: DMT family transporter [Pseudonocardiaceae bacterium]|jgi:glycosyltransferase involved in cell wall biosynthesis|nr:DMT family transporter [Pseudonocardiaceae bacterium]